MAPPNSFSATVEQWGRIYGIEVPTDVSVELGIGGHVPVVGRLNGEAVATTLTPIAGARHRMLLNADIRSTAGLSVGNEVDVVISRDPSNRVPPVPDDLAEALEILASARQRFDNWPLPHRRETLLWIAEAARPETRARRIARAVARVMDDA